MLQAQIFHDDTRGLFVPIGIQKLTIDVKRQAACLQEMASVSEEQGEIRTSLVCTVLKQGISYLSK
jgi:hypothetical protein